jgi:activator of 2-hydroxyglutaryl-CoA dehydratase
MGLYDNRNTASRTIGIRIKNASENAENAALLRQELDEKLTRVANTLATGVSENEITKVYASVAREVEVHRKAAADKGDEQHARY